jgi:urease accessory protein
MRSLWAAARTGCAALCLLAIPTHGYAHTAAKGAGDFYAGLLHPVTALEHILPFVTLGLLAGQQGAKAQGTVLVFALTLMAGAALALWVPSVPYVGLVNILSAVLLGGLVAAAWRLPLVLLYGMTVLFGLSHGFANGTAMSEGLKPYLFIPGVGLAGLLATAYGMITADFLLRQKANWMHIAVRVAGSWIAAIGILVLATSARTILKA